jgi:hypothetical protein
MQGYFLSRPLPAEAFDAWLQGRSDDAALARPDADHNVVELAPKRAVNDGR